MDSELFLSALERVGNVYEQQGKLDQAMEMYQRSLSIRIKQADPSSADVAKTKCNIADVHHAKGDPGRALSLYQEALDSLTKALGPHHAKVAATQNNVANVLSDLGRLDEAKPS
jgi:tetratricopeptide (TPR) repeat protein